MSDGEGDPRWLQAALAEAGAVSGTVHRRRGDRLALTAAVGIPPAVIEAIGEIPRGKGMAGLAWARRRPVSTCNLPDDATGDVRPGARAVRAGAAAAVPVVGPDGAVRAVVGFAFAAAEALTDDDLGALTARASRLPTAE